MQRGNMGTCGASLMSAAVEPCVVRGLDMIKDMRLAHSVTVTAAWLPYFDDGEFESVSPDTR